MGHQNDSRSVHRIVLPSGRAIEVIRIGPEVTPEPGLHIGPEVTPEPGLHICPECRSPLVQPVQWGETTGDCWELSLHCPNCDWTTEGVFDQDQVDAFEELLDDSLADMLGDLRRLTHANMAEEIDRFAAALRSDAILPEDF